MAKYEIKTDGGTFEVETDEPSAPANPNPVRTINGQPFQLDPNEPILGKDSGSALLGGQALAYLTPRVAAVLRSSGSPLMRVGKAVINRHLPGVGDAAEELLGGGKPPVAPVAPRTGREMTAPELQRSTQGPNANITLPEWMQPKGPTIPPVGLGMPSSALPRVELPPMPKFEEGPIARPIAMPKPSTPLPGTNAPSAATPGPAPVLRGPALSSTNEGTILPRVAFDAKTGEQLTPAGEGEFISKASPVKTSDVPTKDYGARGNSTRFSPSRVARQLTGAGTMAEKATPPTLPSVGAVQNLSQNPQAMLAAAELLKEMGGLK